jgi:carbon monoxide dehydrogenase subunit G
MGRIREAVEIEAPADRVWAVVHGDVPNLTRWSENLAHAEVIGGGPLREGSQLRYDVKIVAGTTAALTLLVEQFDEPHRCAGTMSGDAVGGSWSWSYSEDGEVTRVTYESELKVRGAFRFVGAVIERDVRNRMRGNLENLKAYVEAGEGPRGGRPAEGPTPDSRNAA